jgi:Protein of unknown function (DUF3226)
MPKYGCLVVEGPHDAEFVYRLLSPFGMRRIRTEPDLDPFFRPLIPRRYPPDGDLQKRMPTLLFLQSGSHVVGIHTALGDTRLIQTVQEDAVVIDFNRLTGIGILMDSDTGKSPADRYATIRDGLRGNSLAFPDASGIVSVAAPRLGAFVLPDNQTQGTLEDLLLECAGQVYADLLSSATAHVDAALQDQSLSTEDLAELRKPAGRGKAIVSSVASVLRPGRAIQVSIQDNRWLRDMTLTLPRVRAVQDFLVNLLELA